MHPGPSAFDSHLGERAAGTVCPSAASHDAPPPFGFGLLFGRVRRAVTKPLLPLVASIL
jgi:hypothetical protein